MTVWDKLCKLIRPYGSLRHAVESSQMMGEHRVKPVFDLVRRYESRVSSLEDRFRKDISCV